MNKQKEKKWFVFYTKSRAEKKTLILLEQFGFEAFLPLHKVMRQWSDRKKKVEVPLFNSYIFVRDEEYNIPKILQVPGMVLNIKQESKPAVLREQDILIINQFIETGYLLETHSTNDLRIGDAVKIVDGPMRGTRGVMTGEYNKEKFSVMLESLGQVMKVNLDKGILEKE